MNLVDFLDRALSPYFIFLVIVLIARLFVIDVYGVQVPYWDQWDAEADFLFRKWMESSLTLDDFFAPHNEHRIFTTRVLEAVLFALNHHVWDPLLEMRIGAVINALALTLLLYFLASPLKNDSRLALTVLFIGLFITPFGWENILTGFGAQFYFFLLFSIYFLFGVCAYQPTQRVWLLCVLSGLLCPLSLASGAVTLIIGSAAYISRNPILNIDKNKSIAYLYSVVFLFVACASIAISPSPPAHSILKAHSVNQFASALIQVMSWPMKKGIVSALFVQMPLLLFFVIFLFVNEFRTRYNYFVFVIIAWLLSQYAILAYARSVAPVSSRYIDIYSIGLVISFAGMLVILERCSKKLKILVICVMTLWASILGASVWQGKDQLNQALFVKAVKSREQEKNIKNYICDNDFSHLDGKQFEHIPYPSAIRLKDLLDNYNIRRILPINLKGSCL